MYNVTSHCAKLHVVFVHEKLQGVFVHEHTCMCAFMRYSVPTFLSLIVPAVKVDIRLVVSDDSVNYLLDNVLLLELQPRQDCHKYLRTIVSQ